MACRPGGSGSLGAPTHAILCPQANPWLVLGSEGVPMENWAYLSRSCFDCGWKNERWTRGPPPPSNETSGKIVLSLTLPERALVSDSDFQSVVVPKASASASPGSSSETQIPGLPCGIRNSEGGRGPATFDKAQGICAGLAREQAVRNAEPRAQPTE